MLNPIGFVVTFIACILLMFSAQGPEKLDSGFFTAVLTFFITQVIQSALWLAGSHRLSTLLWHDIDLKFNHTRSGLDDSQQSISQ